MEPVDEKATEAKPTYVPPLLEEQDGLIFPEEVWQEFNARHWCFGCTNCNCN